MIDFILDIAGWTLILWLFFIAAATLRDKYGGDDKFVRALIVLFVLGDAAYNITYGSILFAEMPHPKRLLLTARLKDILRREPSKIDQFWRYPIALFMCKYMIEPWDVGHCGLRK